MLDLTAAMPSPQWEGIAVSVFGESLETVVRYVAHLGSSGVERGLVGPREVPRLWSRHVINCGLVSSLIAPGASVGDVGSGAGLPGLVLAVSRPDLSVTLIEPLLRRTTWLEEVVSDLGVSNVTVLRSRAEEVQPQSFSVVTARAVAGLDALLDWTLPLVSEQGQLLAMKGQTAEAELTAAEASLARWGSPATEVVELGADLPEECRARVVAIGPVERMGPTSTAKRAGARRSTSSSRRALRESERR